MKFSVNHIAVLVLSVLFIYVGSYAILRLSVMHFAANRRVVAGQPIIKTWVYFGDGDNVATRAASALYLPMIHLEYHWSRVIIYD